MNKTTNRIAKALGVSALVASLLFGSISCKDSKKTLDEKVIQTSAAQIVQQENPVIQDTKTSQESYIQTEPQTEKYIREINTSQNVAKDSYVVEEKVKENFNMVEYLAKKNTSIVLNKNRFEGFETDVSIGYDLISIGDKKYVIGYFNSDFYYDKGKKKLTVIASISEEHKNAQEGKETFFWITDMFSNISNYMILDYEKDMDFNKTGKFYNGIDDLLYSIKVENNSPLKENSFTDMNDLGEKYPVVLDPFQTKFIYNGNSFSFPAGMIETLGDTSFYDNR